MLRWCLLPSSHPLILSHRPKAVHTHVCVHTAHGRSQSGREGCSKDMFVLTSWNTPLMSNAWNCLVPSQSPDTESNHPSVRLPTNFCGVELLRFPIFAVSFSMTAGLSKGTREILLSIIGSCSLQSSMGGTT